MPKVDSLSINFLSPVGFKRSALRLSLLLIASAAFWLAAAWLYHASHPQFGPGFVEFPSQLPQPYTYPFDKTKLPKSKFTLRQDLQLPRFHPTVFAFYPRDVLWSLKVNGHPIEAPGLPLSIASREGRSIDLAPYLHPGANQLEMEMEVFWGTANLRAYPAPWDKISLLISALILLAALTTAAFCWTFFRLQIAPAEALLLLAGFLLRYIYVLGTPWFTRAFDVQGHIDYLDHIAQHLSLPQPHAGWETYQPPLYYIGVGGITKIALLLGLPPELRYNLWQACSLLFSLGTLLAGLWLGRIIYEKNIPHRLYLLAVVAVAPPLVFTASRVNNDVLITLLDFLWLACLLQYWKAPSPRTWLALSILLGLALLTKASALVLLPLSLLCLYLVPGVDRPAKIRATAVLLGTVALLSGWYYLSRLFHETAVDTYLVGNIRQLMAKAHIDGVFLKSLVFNPWDVLCHPIADPWGPGGDHFLEAFFKSIFLGEWLSPAYRWVARGVILGALLLIPVFAWGVWRANRERQGLDLPLLLTLGALFAAHWIFLQLAPYLSSVDFRYSALLLIPFVNFFIHGAQRLPPRWGEAARFILQLVLLNCAIYLLELALCA